MKIAHAAALIDWQTSAFDRGERRKGSAGEPIGPPTTRDNRSIRLEPDDHQARDRELPPIRNQQAIDPTGNQPTVFRPKKKGQRE
ncbi:MAG: hypothetical protein WAS23_08055 [Dokdonella sp.]|uniref:hypothetical protein n=1 Tax=Dokdonella sp. TaxID=2291710 RepID=UPI002BDDC1EA|nr:hypothetical protein [Dokdonella sp.]HPN80275.1 hypothetical protein [Dokdonella sp.]